MIINAHRQFKRVYLMHQILHVVAAETYSGIEWCFLSNFLSNMYQNFIIYPFLVLIFLYKMLNSSGKGGGY